MAGDPAFPLASGVGYLAYEATARWERVPVPEADPLAMPNAVFHLPSSVIVFDHLAQVARVATLDGIGARDRLADVVRTLQTPAEGEVPATFDAAVVPARSRPGRALPVRGRRRAPGRGDPRRRDAPDGARAPLQRARRGEARIEIYRSLRRINPSPYLFYLDLAAVAPGAAVVGASPELLVRVRDGEVVTRPIAGTRPRYEDPVQDAALEEELRADPKELAEHAMLVDLARNDVGRVAAPASVEVTAAARRRALLPRDAPRLRGARPPARTGSTPSTRCAPSSRRARVSGAPKVRAMQAIAELEGERRGPYGGAVGYFSPSDVECAITIRSALIRDGMAHVHAGRGDRRRLGARSARRPRWRPRRPSMLAAIGGWGG